jgi:hypothetical protein
MDNFRPQEGGTTAWLNWLLIGMSWAGLSAKAIAMLDSAGKS